MKWSHPYNVQSSAVQSTVVSSSSSCSGMLSPGGTKVRLFVRTLSSWSSFQGFQAKVISCILQYYSVNCMLVQSVHYKGPCLLFTCSLSSWRPTNQSCSSPHKFLVKQCVPTAECKKCLTTALLWSTGKPQLLTPTYCQYQLIWFTISGPSGRSAWWFTASALH